MKIIYLHQYFNTPSMQGSTRSYEFARRLVERGHEVRMVTAWRESTGRSNWFVTDEDGIEVHWLPVPYGNQMSYRDRIKAFLRFAWGAGRRAATLEGDVVFATSTPLTIAIPGVYTARRRGLPMVFEVRDLWPEVPIAVGALRNPLVIRAARQLENFAYRNSARVVALSAGMAAGVVRAGYPAMRVDIIPNSCDLDRFAPAPGRAEAFRAAHPELGEGPIVLYAGTLGFVNGVDYLVHVAQAVRERMPAARFVILGAGSEESSIRALAQELGVLDQNLFMYHQVPKVEVVNAFAAASITTSFVTDIAELENNSANKFFDGLAAAKPLAINHGGWQADLIRENAIGLVLSREPGEAASALVAFLNDPDRLDRAGIAAGHLARQFSRDSLTDQLERVLLSVTPS